MAEIRVLDKHVAELIAAGEVVERPASVIKELLENAIDAGARHVTVEIRDGGVTYMRVTDDGCGIPRQELPTAFLRHATSKVRKEEDLASIATLGFRGEALASIAAVARVDVTTCVAGEIAGAHYAIYGGEEQVLEDAGCPVGSTFIVRDLFYNIPARMKFLKKDVSESNAVAGVVERLALSHPEIALRFIRQERTELQTAGDGDLFGCIRAVFGKAFADGLLPVEYAMGGVKVSGFTCKPEAGRQNRTMQHFFINGRYVKTQTAMVAMERAYRGVMMVGKFPTCVLRLEMPPETVDANVHPAKIEVRFINEKPVFDAVYYGVKSAIEAGDSIHRILLRDEAPASRPVAPPPRHPAVTAPLFEVRQTPPTEPHPAASFLDVAVDDRPAEIGLADGTDKPISFTVKAPPEQPVSPPPAAKTEPQAEQTVLEEQAPPVRLIGELMHTYILAEMGDSLYIIDKHAAHERLLYNELKKNARSDAQMLLSPLSVTVSREEHTALTENRDVLSQAGIEVEDFGSSTVLVRAVPMLLSGADIAGLLQEIAAGLAEGGRQVLSAKLDWIYHSSACRAATKAGDHNSTAELAELARRGLTDDSVRYCPHGRPVCVEMTRRELEKQFGRTL